MRKNDPVSNIAIKDVITIQEGQKISDARKIMCNNNIHHIPVVCANRLVGMVSSTDMMKLNLVVNGADERTIDSIIDQQFNLDDIMTTELTTASMKNTVRDVAEILSNSSFHSIPLVDSEGNLEGILTSTDLIKYLCDQY